MFCFSVTTKYSSFNRSFLLKPYYKKSPFKLPTYSSDGGFKWAGSKRGLGAPAIGLAHRGMRGLFGDQGISGLSESYSEGGYKPRDWAAPFLNSLKAMYEPAGLTQTISLMGLDKLGDLLYEKSDTKKKVQDETKNVLSS